MSRGLLARRPDLHAVNANFFTTSYRLGPTSCSWRTLVMSSGCRTRNKLYKFWPALPMCLETFYFGCRIVGAVENCRKVADDCFGRWSLMM
jgi:hypothetical protein